MQERTLTLSFFIFPSFSQYTLSIHAQSLTLTLTSIYPVHILTRNTIATYYISTHYTLSYFINKSSTRMDDSPKMGNTPMDSSPKDEDDVVMDDVSYIDDAEYARRLQEQFNKELEGELQQRSRCDNELEQQGRDKTFSSDVVGPTQTQQGGKSKREPLEDEDMKLAREMQQRELESYQYCEGELDLLYATQQKNKEIQVLEGQRKALQEKIEALKNDRTELLSDSGSDSGSDLDAEGSSDDEFALRVKEYENQGVGSNQNTKGDVDNDDQRGDNGYSLQRCHSQDTSIVQKPHPKLKLRIPNRANEGFTKYFEKLQNRYGKGSQTDNPKDDIQVKVDEVVENDRDGERNEGEEGHVRWTTPIEAPKSVLGLRFPPRPILKPQRTSSVEEPSVEDDLRSSVIEKQAGNRDLRKAALLKSTINTLGPGPTPARLRRTRRLIPRSVPDNYLLETEDPPKAAGTFSLQKKKSRTIFPRDAVDWSRPAPFPPDPHGNFNLNPTPEPTFQRDSRLSQERIYTEWILSDDNIITLNGILDDIEGLPKILALVHHRSTLTQFEAPARRILLVPDAFLRYTIRLLNIYRLEPTPICLDYGELPESCQRDGCDGFCPSTPEDSWCKIGTEWERPMFLTRPGTEAEYAQEEEFRSEDQKDRSISPRGSCVSPHSPPGFPSAQRFLRSPSPDERYFLPAPLRERSPSPSSRGRRACTPYPLVQPPSPSLSPSPSPIPTPTNSPPRNIPLSPLPGIQNWLQEAKKRKEREGEVQISSSDLVEAFKGPPNFERLINRDQGVRTRAMTKRDAEEKAKDQEKKDSQSIRWKEDESRGGLASGESSGSAMDTREHGWRRLAPLPLPPVTLKEKVRVRGRARMRTRVDSTDVGDGESRKMSYSPVTPPPLPSATREEGASDPDEMIIDGVGEQAPMEDVEGVFGDYSFK
ncbi:hypothetical protein K505DRAFT_338941 [Melanomma pulvis-pyrius CBS 109.77]|uniref:Uncharacterized protein n=1 Tax=Melanomma pulvis-pyrius CBS 109.77 TaxID=1314802 RepID=A0A6A6X814_9PLEO|nr:hypothetical protein K505DRAFT_338941 [Melanomma pulvis-pyrius CBS 109.77]